MEIIAVYSDDRLATRQVEMAVKGELQRLITRLASWIRWALIDF